MKLSCTRDVALPLAAWPLPSCLACEQDQWHAPLLACGPLQFAVYMARTLRCVSVDLRNCMAETARSPRLGQITSTGTQEALPC